MTRAEFIDSMYCWSELLGFCYDHDCCNCDDVRTSDKRNESINDALSDAIQSRENWRDVLETLKDHHEQDGYEYYIEDEYGEWSGAGDYEFDQHKTCVLDWMDENEYWDDDDEAEDPEEESAPEQPSEQLPDNNESFEGFEEIPLEELFCACSEGLCVIDGDEETKEECDDFGRKLSEFMQSA